MDGITKKYSLELSNWGTYELVEDFSSMSVAVKHGEDKFPQNEWRVLDRVGGAIVHENDPFASIEEQAGQEIKRFDDTEKWRLRFQEQAEREVITRQERERLAEINIRQRQAQRQRRGSHDIFGHWLPPFETDIARNNDDEDEDDGEWDLDEDRLDLSREKVNWLVEGF